MLLIFSLCHRNSLFFFLTRKCKKKNKIRPQTEICKNQNSFEEETGKNVIKIKLSKVKRNKKEGRILFRPSFFLICFYLLTYKNFLCNHIILGTNCHKVHSGCPLMCLDGKSVITVHLRVCFTLDQFSG